MKERIIIVFVAIVLGLIITTIGFFLYQSTKILPQDQPKNSTNNKKISPTPSQESGIMLIIDEPKDLSITDKRTVVVKGKTDPKNTIIVSTNEEDSVASPNSLGEFSVSVTIDAGANKIITRSITSEGEEKDDVRTVTFTTEDF